MTVKEFLETIKDEARFNIYHVGKRNGKVSWITYCPNKESVGSKYGYLDCILVEVKTEDFKSYDNVNQRCYGLYIY